MNQSTSTLRPEVSAGQLVFQVASGYMASAALQVAMRLDIAARLSNGPRPVADLAREAGVQTDGLYRVLRALASLGIFAESSPRTFALTPAAEFPGGRERTAEGFGALFNRAGFTLTMVVPTESMLRSIVETARSIGRVKRFSISCGPTPSYRVTIVMRGKSTSGR